MPNTFADHFSATAADYATFRPVYPDALFAWLAGLMPAHDLAWDCGCGTGQASIGLTSCFKKVYATDPSSSQIAAAFYHDRIEYRVTSEDNSGLADQTADLITVAQALHWFRLDAFNAEVRRVIKPDGIVAVWCYGKLMIRQHDDIQLLLDNYYYNTIWPYWPAERRHVDTAYSDLDLEIEALESPDFSMQADLSVPELMGYISTWSATRHYIQARRHDPVPELAQGILAMLDEPDQKIRVNWPLTVIAGSPC